MSKRFNTGVLEATASLYKDAFDRKLKGKEYTDAVRRGE